METDKLLPTDKFCTYYNVEYSFVESLMEIGLIDTIVIQETEFIHIPHLQKIERIIRLYDDLNINLEGIEVIQLLLERQEQMNEQINSLKNRLRFYEG
ncbi:chaperone modulator CbpM [Dyadobacter sp. NIV53]|uniref:chaperone modulator CbpM n=1 Tax=Dyadobacter sp. NIV53 TaxID=2861765 RepID=UPI001C88342B|nr:chaperone modulator CbpM [Dyadobacter sp. NIV53]